MLHSCFKYYNTNTLNEVIPMCYMKLLKIYHFSQTHLFNITLVDLQLDAQNSYLSTYNTPIKILYLFRALLCYLQEVYVVIVYMQYLVCSS